MRQIHRTKEGLEIDISEMNDKHLLNTIALAIDTLQKAIVVVKNQDIFIQSKLKNTEYSRKAYEVIDSFNDYIAPYVLEAFKRGLNLNTLQERFLNATHYNDNNSLLLEFKDINNIKEDYYE